MAYFLMDKNEFINEFKVYLENEGRKLNLFTKRNYIAILEILKSEMDLVLRDFKNLKQKMLKKIRKKENFWKIKEDFIRNYKQEDEVSGRYTVNAVTSILQSNYNKIATSVTGKTSINENMSKIKNSMPFEKNNNIIEDRENIENIDKNKNNEIYRDSAHTLSLFKEAETKDLDTTRHIITELSDLMTNFSTKVLEHQNITQNIISNASQSLDNAQKANKELVKAQDYQKGRGLLIGGIFIILGIFLIYYDYVL